MIELYSKKQLREICTISPAHIDREEKAGRFPKRVRISQNRVGWVASEIEDWLQQKIAERDAAAP